MRAQADMMADNQERRQKSRQAGRQVRVQVDMMADNQERRQKSRQAGR